MPRSNTGSLPFPRQRASSRSTIAHSPVSVWKRLANGLRFAAEVVMEARAMQARERLTGKGRQFADW